MFIEIGDHWQFDDFFGSHFENGGLAKLPWKQISSLPTNSSLPNTHIYHFLLKSETINNMQIMLAAILETVAS